jgi:hypothetical protein
VSDRSINTEFRILCDQLAVRKHSEEPENLPHLLESPKLGPLPNSPTRKRIATFPGKSAPLPPPAAPRPLIGSLAAMSSPTSVVPPQPRTVSTPASLPFARTAAAALAAQASASSTPATQSSARSPASTQKAPIVRRDASGSGPAPNARRQSLTGSHAVATPAPTEDDLRQELTKSHKWLTMRMSVDLDKVHLTKTPNKVHRLTARSLITRKKDHVVVTKRGDILRASKYLPM